MTPPVPPAPRPPLPRGVRFAAVLSLVLSLFTGFFTLGELTELQQLEAAKAARQAPRMLLVEDPILAARMSEARLAALQSMRDSRGVVLGSLLVAYTLVFVSAARMLRPEGLSLESLRRLLAGSLLSAALLRTVEGAQSAVLAQRMSPAMTEALRAMPDLQPEDLEALGRMPWLAASGAVLFTALVAGAFSLLAQYFRGERVRQALEVRREPFIKKEE